MLFEFAVRGSLHALALNGKVRCSPATQQPSTPRFDSLRVQALQSTIVPQGKIASSIFPVLPSCGGALAGKQQMLLFNRDGQKMDGIVLRKKHRDSGWAWVTSILTWDKPLRRYSALRSPFVFFLKSLHCISAFCIVHTTPRITS